jgi:preprotein translocase subunit Sec63
MAPLLSEEELALGDPYEVLGVPVDATEKQIRSAYRSLSLRCHPDRVSPGLGSDTVWINSECSANLFDWLGFGWAVS